MFLQVRNNKRCRSRSNCRGNIRINTCPRAKVFSDSSNKEAFKTVSNRSEETVTLDDTGSECSKEVTASMLAKKAVVLGVLMGVVSTSLSGVGEVGLSVVRIDSLPRESVEGSLTMRRLKETLYEISHLRFFSKTVWATRGSNFCALVQKTTSNRESWILVISE
jgi:hypothetical protein